MAFSKSDALELLMQASANGRLAHAYLITGPEQSGKRALAEKVAAFVIGEKFSAVENAPLKHPDVHVAEPESKSRRIVIDQIREMEHELRMRPSSAAKKVGMIFDADRLQTQAANAFLKTLEEPPNNSLLLLTSSQPELLPDTILSRCIAVPLMRAERAKLSDSQKELLDAVREIFREKNRDVAAIYRLIRKLTVLLQQIRAEITDENDADLKAEETRYKQTTDSRAWLEDREDFYKALGESRYIARRAALVECALQWWADVLRQQHGGADDALDLPDFAKETAELARAISAHDALRRLKALEDLRENLDRNVKEDLAIEVAFLNAFE